MWGIHKHINTRRYKREQHIYNSNRKNQTFALWFQGCTLPSSPLPGYWFMSSTNDYSPTDRGHRLPQMKIPRSAFSARTQWRREGETGLWTEAVLIRLTKKWSVNDLIWREEEGCEIRRRGRIKDRLKNTCSWREIRPSVRVWLQDKHQTEWKS